MKPSDEDLEAIRKALHPALADRIRDRKAEVTPYPVPGLPGRLVWRVRIEDADHPMQTYVGLWPGGTARVLSDDQPAFFDLVSAHHTEIKDPEIALGYVLAFLEVTRGPMVIVRPLSDPADIRWRPGTDDEEARREAFLADSSIRPPSAKRTDDGFHVEAWLIVDQRIQRNTFEVAKDGTISAQFRVVAADLPLPIAL